MLFNSEQHEVIARQLGRIAVSLHADGSNAVVTIEDTGLGISARLLPFIFDQYASWPDTLSTTLRTARGLALLHAVRPDAAIIDIGLPGMDGYQIAKRIRQDDHGRCMLLLALSGYDPPADWARSESGFDYHLVKPVDADQLARLLSDGA